MYQHCIKRLIDLVLSLMAFAMLSPLLIVMGTLVRIKLGSPILFKQCRPGKNEIIFYILKFRTMMNAKDENGNLLFDVLRLTQFGGFLRSTSIDKLSELINILKGDMSIVKTIVCQIFTSI